MDYISEFFLVIAATLAGNWLWQLWLDRRETKKQKAQILADSLEKIQSCVYELEYNATPGIGGPKSPFKLTAQEQLLHSAEVVSLLGGELTNSLKELIIEAGLANGEYSMKGPGRAKATSKLLKEFLQKRSEELKASSNTLPIRRFSLQRFIKFCRPK